jgi:hypothetical protein
MNQETTPERHQRVVLGVELEAYTIQIPGFRISRQMAFPRKGVGEKGERFTRDTSIGTEYNSQPFSSIREGLFLLKAGLRKYSLKLYRSTTTPVKGKQLLLVGGWRDRFAGAHLHLSLADRELSKPEAKRLAWHIHDHIPFLVAVGANSPVWADRITEVASNRVDRASQQYFRPIARTELTLRTYDEMLYSRGRKLKPATLEIRVLDSNIPEYVLAAATVVKAVALNWLDRRPAPNRVSKAAYTRSRQDAAARGMRARLCWNGRWVTVPRYLDLLVWSLRHIFAEMDVPEEIWTTFLLLKRRLNGAAVLAQAANLAYAEHPQTWQQRFARRYAEALDHLLSGNSPLDFVKRLRLPLPNLHGVWVGRKNLRLP